MEDSISILVVEDEEIWIENLSMILEGFGYPIVAVARNSTDALAAFSTHEYDVILMDIHLDGSSSGIELGKVVHNMYHKPFIFITSSNDHNFREAAAAHPSAYLTKPVNAHSLYVAIQNGLHNFTDKLPATLPRAEEDAPSSFFVKNGNRYKRLEWADVVYLSATKNYIAVFNAPDKTEYFIRGSLQKALQEMIPKRLQQQFIQVNRGDAVQHSFIQEISGDEVRTAYKTFATSDIFSKEMRAKMNFL